MNNKKEITLKITNAGIKTEFENENGIITYKNIGLDALIKVLNHDLKMDTGILPLFGNNYIGIKRYIKSGDKEILLIEGSPALRTVNYQAEKLIEIKNVPFPGLLMAVICRSDRGKIRVSGSRLYATKGPLIRDTDRLYRFPFGNVYSDGRICWGSVKKDNIRTITQAGSLLDIFLSGSMNNDLTKSGLKSRLIGLQESGLFDYETLKDDGINIKELLSLLMNKRVG